jgi:Kef-type K+ transport system membrane component KefB
MQIIVILVAARLVGWAFRKIRQPQVVGEMAAGILLGPSLLGWIAPEIYQGLFPMQSLGLLNALSQVGLMIFMFLIGLELDLHVVKNRGKTTLITSIVSIVLPFSFGGLLAIYLYPYLSEKGISFTVFALFIGAAMSITAFPVLARILTERKLLRTEMGAVAIACAAVNDVAGWMILAIVLLLARASETSLLFWEVLIGVAVYVLVMIFPLRRWARRIEAMYERRGEVSQGMLAMILVFALGSAWMTETLGIHALFGAFMAGVAMPRQRSFIHALIGKMNDFTVVFLLPLFFAYTGLRASLGLLNDAALWLDAGLILLVAVGGKFVGAALPARWTGMSWREAGALGALMNTRGLMELVLLNIGLDIGVITPTLFTMLVIMALVTTFMTSPLVEWIYFRRLAPKGEYQPTAPEVVSPDEVDEALAVE